MGRQECAVKNCSPQKTDSRHRFINPKKDLNMFKLWLKATGNNVLQQVNHQFIYDNMRICSTHSKEDDFELVGPKQVLKKNAVPFYHLPVDLSCKVDHLKYPDIKHLPVKDISQVAQCHIPPPAISTTSWSTPLASISENCYQLTEKKKLHKKAQYYKRKSWLLKQRRKSFTIRLKEAENFFTSKSFVKLTKNMETIARNFFKCQVEAFKRKEGSPLYFTR